MKGLEHNNKAFFQKLFPDANCVDLAIKESVTLFCTCVHLYCDYYVVLASLHVVVCTYVCTVCISYCTYTTSFQTIMAGYTSLMIDQLPPPTNSNFFHAIFTSTVHVIAPKFSSHHLWSSVDLPNTIFKQYVCTYMCNICLQTKTN